MIFRANGMRIVAIGSTLGLLIVALMCQGAEAAGSGQQIVRVEEDWELVVVQPDPNSAGPQITCVISPVDHADGLHAALNLNHRTLPEFSSGGVQLQVWNGERVLSQRSARPGRVFEQSGELVRWTQCMELQGERLTFETINGCSPSLGNFGGVGTLRSTVAVSLENLNQYSPEVSLKNSGISFADNRVGSLTLKRIKVVTRSGDELQFDVDLRVK